MRLQWRRMAAVLAGGLLMAGSAAAESDGSALGGLRHAVICPPFKGPAEPAEAYHAEMVKLLEASEGIELMEGSRSLLRRSPEFTFRVNGAVVEQEDGQMFVTVSVVDSARREQIASLVAPAFTNRQAMAAWKRTVRESIERRVAKLPFECRIRRKAGQQSYSLDRGLGAGLEPGMVLYVATDEEPILSQTTGEIIGRESSRPVGQIEVFRVMDHTAYARPVAGTSLPRSASLFARTF